MSRKKLEERTGVTQKDVARLAGVTPSSVSYVINNGPRSVSEETKQRVLKAIEELGYRPNEYAQKLMRQHWGSETPPRQFGIVLAGPRALIARPYYSALIVGMLDEAISHNYALRFIHLYDELRNPLLFNELIHRESVAGVVLMHILAPVHRDRELLEEVVRRIGNVICLDFSWPGLPSITFDKLQAGSMVADYLIKLGHTRIGYLGDPDTRFDGFLQSFRRHGLHFDPALAPGDPAKVDGQALNAPESGLRGALQLLRLPQPPTAIFAASDEVAIGALRAARECGVQVPQELSVVGLDDIELASYASPPLTTIHVPKVEMAELAMRTLIDRVDRPSNMSINMVLPTQLIERGSCAAPRKA
jgi:DNA-binding LacI/PurR family transcriptional regulator